MLSDRDRLRRRAAAPRLVALHRALGRLRSTVTVMNTGAHPDDEHNGMLATLRHQHGVRIVVACSTRGEGGQNTLGPERQGALGVIRSREMEEAARVLDADIAWLGHGPDDPVHDFGFSKSGPDTLARWGETLILDRLVRAYRQFRPDIVIPTFLDVPGQHGHHRAMTQAAERAIALAADPNYATDDLSPWQVAKFYLPAWSGGGDTYDDEEPPPPATTTITADGVDPATGMSFARLGEVSRAFHATQNMGHWQYPPANTWSLHLKHGGPEASIFQTLPQRLADLGTSPGLAQATAAIERAIQSFPDNTAIWNALTEARTALSQAQVDVRHSHRLERKKREIDAALALAAGVEVSVSLSHGRIVPGGRAELVIEAEHGRATTLSAQVHAHPDILAPGPTTLSDGVTALPLEAKAEAAISNAFLPDWQSLGGNGLASVEITATIADQTIRFLVDPEEPLQIDPLHTLSVTPDAVIVPSGQAITKRLTVKGATAETLSLAPVPGVTMKAEGTSLALDITADLPRGRHTVSLSVAGAPAYAVTPIEYPHIGSTRFVRPQHLDLLSLDLIVPQARIGYVGGGADRVGLWLERIGADVTALDADALGGDLSQYDTIVVGIFAFGTRPDLAAATAKLHDWVRAGGHLVTLYHRPSDGWHPQKTPPLMLTIGSPSLRWRVTNPQAPVSILEPSHKLFAGPNQIGAADFDGWDKERGLYFASDWDHAYVPLLGMSDAGEQALTGSLLSAEIGSGRHTHTSLVLHHQMDKLVSGAFRLMANLLQAA